MDLNWRFVLISSISWASSASFYLISASLYWILSLTFSTMDPLEGEIDAFLILFLGDFETVCEGTLCLVVEYLLGEFL